MFQRVWLYCSAVCNAICLVIFFFFFFNFPFRSAKVVNSKMLHVVAVMNNRGHRRAINYRQHTINIGVLATAPATIK